MSAMLSGEPIACL